MRGRDALGIYSFIFFFSVINQVNLVSLVLSGMKFSGMFLPCHASFFCPVLDWHWMEAVNLLEHGELTEHFSKKPEQGDVNV